MYFYTVNSPIIYFDGECNLCNKSVNSIIKKDKKHLFYFAFLSDPNNAQKIPKSYLSIDSIILEYDNNFYTKSDAIIEICKLLGGIYKIMAIGYLIPRIIRDKIYDFVARNRYKWFGKSESCLTPTPNLRKRFL